MKTRNSIFLLFLFVMGHINSPAQTKLDAYFDHLFQHKKFMGSVAISFKDSIIYSRTAGYAQVATQKKIDYNTRFRVGSITKTYTAVLLLKAVEEGKIKLTDSLAKWFPQFEHSEKITIELLLKNRSGIFNFTEIPGETEWEETAHTQEEFIAYTATPPSNFEPGSAYEYSNTNYALLGFILEKIYNKDYNYLLQEKICNPLGLTNTYYSFINDTASNEAYSYNIQHEYIRNSNVHYSNDPGSGGILSTPQELNRFITALFDGKIIRKESLALMLPANKGEYGMGLEKINFSNHEAYSHSGRIENYISDYWYFPEDKLGLVTLANATNINTDEIQMTLLRFAYGNAPELADYDQITGLSKEAFGKIKGTYFNKEKTYSITISSDSEYLIFQDSRAGQMYVPFTHVNDNTFEYADIKLQFFPAKNEVIQDQGGVRFIFTKVAAE